jgi:cyclopropane fatty-acyl-phospholipid synthase-like methyltransferase
MEKIYWENYYKKHREPTSESPFAKYISKYLKKDKLLIELGCGNGRDSTYFSKLGVNTVGVDQCQDEIKHLSKKYSSNNLSFKIHDFTRMSTNKQYNYIYSRFTLHSVDEDAENRVLKWAYNSLHKYGLFFIELRSIDDDMYKKGIKKRDNVSITDHYRRFAEFDKLKNKLTEEGFDIIESIKSKGIAKHNNEDPVVVRFIAKKVRE